MRVRIEFKPKQVTYFLSGIVALLSVVHLLGQLNNLVFKQDDFFGLIPLFDLDVEHNFPSFYSSATLLLTSFLLAVIASSNKKSDKHLWVGLSFVFCFLAADEAIGMHEHLTKLREMLHVSGLFYYAWVIPYGIAFAIFALVYLRFTFNLPTKIRQLFILACLIYVGGSIGFEMIGGWYRETYNWDMLAAGLISIEELMEMVGIIIFIHALTSYIENGIPKEPR